MALPAHTSLLRHVIAAAALFGVLIAAHLGLQKEVNDFAYGCTGLAEPVTAVTTGEASGCAAVTSSAYADFLGVSNIVWGLVFYLLIVGLRLAYAASSDDRLRLASFGALGVGVLYSAYLTYLQVAEIGSFCALCLTSAVTVLTLFVLHVIEHRRLKHAVSAAPRRARADQRRGLSALRPYAPLIGLFAILLAADVVFAARSEAEPREAVADQPADITAIARGAQDTPASGDPAAANAQASGTCSYDPAFAPITDLSPFTDGPFRGSADAPVTVVEVFDPNCPHCKDLAEIVDPLVESVGDQARFYYVPYPLRQESVGQVVAFKLAAREGKFFELMEEMFDRQGRSWGMDLPELLATIQAVGMNPTSFRATVEDQAQLQPILDQINADVTAVGSAFATADGGLSVPKLAINGRIVSSTYATYTEECLTRLINEAAGSTP